jgi:hypothetical protein
LPDQDNMMMSTIHGSAGFLLLALAMTSVVIAVLIAVKPAADPVNIGLVKRANFVTAIEIITAIVVTVSGVVATIKGTWSLTELWLWLSLVVMAFYLVALGWITKPARMAVATGGSQVKSGMQVVLQMGHVLLLFGAFAMMELKPV